MRAEQLDDSFEFSPDVSKADPPPLHPILISDLPRPSPNPIGDVVPEDDGFKFTDKGAQSEPQPTDPIIIADIPAPTPQPVEPDASQHDDRWAYHEADGRDEWIDIAG